MGQNDSLPTFRYALEQSPAREMPGGTAREATIKQLPISTGLAGVSMKLKPGAIRELHWHAIAAEWAYVIRGNVRTTIVGPGGTCETNDFAPGDVWYFPRGHGHAIACLGDEECHFLLIFDNGAFSEFGTFSSTDWVGHIDASVLGRCLGVSAAELSGLAHEELYIVQGRPLPATIEPNRGSELRPAPQTHRYPFMAQPPWETFSGGRQWRVTVDEFPISTTMSASLFELEPGAVREPHWHPHANEWQYVLEGTVRVGLFGSGGRARVEQLNAGDVGYAPRGYGHYIENCGDKMCRILVAFDSGQYQEISLSTWLSANPAGMVADNFQVPDALVAKWPTKRVFVAKK